LKDSEHFFARVPINHVSYCIVNSLHVAHHSVISVEMLIHCWTCRCASSMTINFDLFADLGASNRILFFDLVFFSNSRCNKKATVA
jgi:hypothetical protein